MRTAARVASRLEAPWHAIYIETPELERLSEAGRHRILRNLKLAEELGAQTATLSGSSAEEVAVKYARDHNLAKVFVGRDHPRLWRPWHRSFADRIGQQAPDLDVLQVARAESERDGGKDRQADSRESVFDQWPAYLKAAVGCALAGFGSAALFPIVDLPTIVMVFLLAVVLVSVRYGRGPGVLASFLSVGIFDFFFVQPRFSFAVSDVQYLMTFAVMLVVGLITGQLTAGSKYQAKVATRREQRVRSLYEMSRDLSAALMPEQIAEIGQRFIVAELGAKAAFLLADENDRLKTVLPTDQGLPGVDPGIAQWAFDHAEAAGQGTNTLAASPILYLPLKAPMRLRGVLALEMRNTDRLLIPEQRRLLDTFASLIAIALERVHYVEVAQDTTVQMESERLRNSVLSAISHDLRTPMSVLVGLADSLFLTQPPPTGQQTEIARALKDEALRVSGQVNNLLDMARLQSGRIELNLQWQPLEEVVVSALKTLERAFVEHRIKVSLDDNLPLVNIDSVLMERVIYNLLENTVKYTPAGSSVEIGANVRETVIEVWVDDNGPGLPEGKEDVIFKKFERGQPEGATRGVGLGLAICRAIVEAHAGEIHAENRPQGGARFIFTLPRGNPPSLDVEELPEEEETR